MKLAFLVVRKSYYMVYGALIDEALRRGWDVECWHDMAQARHGRKGYQFPDLDAVPSFRFGQPIVKTFIGPQALVQGLAAAGVSMVVSLQPSTFYLGKVAKPSNLCWIGLQHFLDLFINGGLRGALSRDLLTVYTPWWVDWAHQYFVNQGYLQPGTSEEQVFRLRCRLVGFPVAEQREMIDPEQVRHRWRLPADRPVVLYLPFPGASNGESFWAGRIFLQPSRSLQMIHLLAQRQWRYWPAVRHGWNEAHMIRAVRTFCDRNGALLVVKSRQKTPIPPYVRAVADRCLYDEGYYPSTIMEAMSIASLCINYYSAAVAEASVWRVPNLCLRFSGNDYFGWDPVRQRGFESFFHAKVGGFFEYPGVSQTLAIPEAISRLPRAHLDEFVTDPQAHQAYCARFFGPADQQPSARFMDLCDHLAAGGQPWADAHLAAHEQSA